MPIDEGKEVRICVWNKGNANCFGGKKESTPISGFHFLRACPRKLTRERDKRTANHHMNGRIRRRTTVSARPPHVRPPRHACLRLAAASLQAASPAPLGFPLLCAARSRRPRRPAQPPHARAPGCADVPLEKRRERNAWESNEWMRLFLYYYLPPTCMKVQWHTYKIFIDKMCN